MDLPKVLAELRAAGVTRARYSEKGKNGAGESSIEVEFGPQAPQVRPAGLVTADGKPLDLDAGMNSLHRDPLGEEDEERAAPDKVLERNFRKAPDAPS